MARFETMTELNPLTLYIFIFNRIFFYLIFEGIIAEGYEGKGRSYGGWGGYAEGSYGGKGGSYY